MLEHSRHNNTYRHTEGYSSFLQARWWHRRTKVYMLYVCCYKVRQRAGHTQGKVEIERFPPKIKEIDGDHGDSPPRPCQSMEWKEMASME